MKYKRYKKLSSIKVEINESTYFQSNIFSTMEAQVLKRG